MNEHTLKEVFTKITEDNLLPENIFQDIYKQIKFDIQDDESFYEPLYPGFDNFDKRLSESVDTPIFLNDYDLNTEEGRNDIRLLMKTEFTDNNFSTIGSCTCGKYKKNMYVNTNFRCDVCNTEVVKPLSSEYATKLWLRCPANVSGFINPAIYDVFLTLFYLWEPQSIKKVKSPRVCIVKYWIDDRYRKEILKKNNESLAAALEAFTRFREDIGVGLGYNEFVENIDKIITNLLFNEKYRIVKVGSARPNADKLAIYLEFWTKFKSYAVSKCFPVPNKASVVVEFDGPVKYHTEEQIIVYKTITAIADLHDEGSPKAVNNPTILGRLYHQLTVSLTNLRAKTIYGKKGFIRHSAAAGRLPFTGRSVISGESGVCRSDTVIVPWHYSLTVMDKHLTNWLYRRGYTPLEVKKLIRNAANKCCPIVNEFITWAEDNHYIIAIVGRNPTIQYLSARAMFVKFNRDVNDQSIRIPITSTRQFGADFDGDCQYIRILPDLISKINAYGAWGHQQCLDSAKPFNTGGFCYQTKTNLVSVNSLLINTPIKKT